MKTTFLLLVILFGISPLSWAQPNSSEELIAAFRTAIREKSVEKLNAITYMVGMSESDKQQAAQVQKLVFSDREIENVSLDPLPEDFQSVYIMRGMKLEPTYPPAGMIKTNYKGTGNGVNSSSVAYAVIDGRYYFISMKSTDLGWKGPPDKTITFMVVGNGQDKVQIKAKWNASGVEQERVFRSPSSNFFGQYFENVTVTSMQDDVDVTLTIIEDGKTIFTSPALKGRGVVEYNQ